MLRNLISVFLLLSTLAVAGIAQQTANASGAPAVRSHHNEFVNIVKSIAGFFKAKVLVEPAIFAANPPKEPAGADNIDAALTALVKDQKDVAYRTVYLKKADPTKQVSVEKIAASLRALDLLDQSEMVVANSGKSKALSVKKEETIDPATIKDVDPVYVIYYSPPDINAIGAGKAMQDRYMDLQRQSLQMMLQMDQSQMSDMMMQGMKLWMNLDPSTRSQFMVSMIKGGMQMMNSFTQDQKAEFGRTMGQVIQQMQAEGSLPTGK